MLYLYNIVLRIVASYVVIVVLCSCQNGETRMSNDMTFPKVTEITPKKIILKENIRPIDIVFSKNYIIVQNEVESDGQQLYVYDASTHVFLYSFANRGNGHYETMALDMVQNPIGDTLKIIDQARYKILSYVLDNDTAKLIGEDRIKMKSQGALQEVYQHNDSIILFYTLENKIYTYNINNHEVVDEFMFPNIFDDLSIQEQKEILNFHLAYNEGLLCVAFRHLNCLTVGYIDNENKIMVNVDRLKAHKNDAIDNGILYYMYVDMNEDYIIAEYMGYKLSMLSRFTKSVLPKADFRFYLECYDTELNPKLFIKPTSDIFRIKINSRDRSIYSWDIFDKNENLLRMSLE